MPDYPPLTLPDDPKLLRNITHFARALRKAGLPVGPGRVLDAVRAVAAAGFTSRQDFYWALHACFVTKPEQRVVFAQVFRLFWRDPRYLEQMMAAMLPAIRGVQEERPAKPAEKRAAEALLDGMLEQPDLPEAEQEGTEIEIDASRTMSAEERLRTLDFEQMSTAEIAAAKRILAQLKLPVTPIQSRRLMAAPRGQRADWRRTLRNAARQGGDLQQIARAKRRIRWPNLVVLCDISGSMSQYSRIILHFLHAAANARGTSGGQGWARVHGFTFGTRLTNITRHLAQRDVDAALAAAGAEAQDWEGGTRIGDCLHAFNRDWSRRVMGQGAVVLLITDGLDRGDAEGLSREMQRLQLSSRRLIWLNPLLRWDGFAPKAQGIRAMLPYTDSFRAGHSIASLQDLAQVISSPSDAGEKARLMGML
ncbi:vWA domain-containing protein [Leisingera sp. ANG-M6]|uniref:vWA domain-containing protein n=1 Tax=Leisingera sp. ANG-M6 TaxID=1577900 RepID=UPI00057C5466|nr:VWA domain-containing protein [Leisingera sp. ANG-M6]KIC29890.1 von Willebrand factor A [Leisingera sp. ANG-M6]